LTVQVSKICVVVFTVKLSVPGMVCPNEKLGKVVRVKSKQRNVLLYVGVDNLDLLAFIEKLSLQTLWGLRSKSVIGDSAWASGRLTWLAPAVHAGHTTSLVGSGG
jgi:hypothetical protein